MSKRNPTTLDDLESEFDYESEAERKKLKRTDFLTKEHPGVIAAPGRSEARELFDEEHGKDDRRRRRFSSLDVYSRHKELINQYYLYYPGATKRLQRDTSNDRTDLDVIRQNHKFIWTANDDSTESWEKKLAKCYYDKLFKEYCITDLSRYKENKVALRWRVEKEVVEGKGQFICGNKTCQHNTDLTSWEVNFGYVENGTKRNALVKLRLCPECSDKLNYYQKRNKAKKRKTKSQNDNDQEVDETSTSCSSTNSATIPIKLEKVDEMTESEKKAAVEKAETAAKTLWAQPVQLEHEKNRVDEFEDFLDDLLL